MHYLKINPTALMFKNNQIRFPCTDVYGCPKLLILCQESCLTNPKSYLVVNCQYIAQDYLITKAKMPTNSEAMAQLSFSLFRVMRGQRRRIIRDWVQGQAVPFCSLQQTPTKHNKETDFCLLVRFKQQAKQFDCF